MFDLEKEVKRRFHYDPDTGLFTYKIKVKRINPGDIASSISNLGYRRVRIFNKWYQQHRLAFIAMGHKIPDFVDHINGDRSDNRWANIRPCTKSQNSMNKFYILKNSISGIRGVNWHKTERKWQVLVCVSGKRMSFGLYGDIELAEMVAVEAREKFHGEFANHSGVRNV
jgi:hypothetical protein